jgi:SAM-dependent methyltransferase/ribosomal protein S18 acetylase RimI-like enzyme
VPRFVETSVTSADGAALLEEYFAFRAASFPVAGAYRITPPEPSQFVRPTGVFVVVYDGENALGCGGVRMLGPGRAEIKHVWLRPEARGRGLGHTLLGELERVAEELGAIEAVLDTNSSLAAAGALYRSRGYADVAAYNTNPNANVWLRKVLHDRAATAEFYDTVAATYAEVITGTEAEAPLDLGFLEHFISLVPPNDKPLLDAGCGAGRMLDYLADRGVNGLTGIDLSSQMVAISRASHPGIPVAVGDILDLAFDPDSVRAILCWYAIIHLDPAGLNRVATEFARVLCPGGVALFGFQAGIGNRRIERAYGHDATLIGVLHSTSSVSQVLQDHGLEVIAVGERAPVRQERSKQGFVLAQKPQPNTHA